MPTYTPATEAMRDVLREGRFRTEPSVSHALAMDLMAQEAALDVWIAGWDGIRSPRDVAHDALAEMRRRALVRSYEGRLPRIVAERAALKAAA
jgi:hypothetical protein